MENKSGIHPTEYKVLVKPESASEEMVSKFKGLAEAGFKMAEPEAERLDAGSTKGTIIDISPLAFQYDDWPSNERIPALGDRVAFARFAGVSIDGDDGEKYRLVNDKDIIAILRAA